MPLLSSVRIPIVFFSEILNSCVGLLFQTWVCTWRTSGSVSNGAKRASAAATPDSERVFFSVGMPDGFACVPRCRCPPCHKGVFQRHNRLHFKETSAPLQDLQINRFREIETCLYGDAREFRRPHTASSADNRQLATLTMGARMVGSGCWGLLVHVVWSVLFLAWLLVAIAVQLATVSCES